MISTSHWNFSFYYLFKFKWKCWGNQSGNYKSFQWFVFSHFYVYYLKRPSSPVSTTKTELASLRQFEIANSAYYFTLENEKKWLKNSFLIIIKFYNLSGWDCSLRQEKILLRRKWMLISLFIIRLFIDFFIFLTFSYIVSFFAVKIISWFITR